jgi:hypothetical protein
MTQNTSYRRILHKMGYYDYQHGLICRHLKQQGGWNSHLEHCRSLILKALDIHKPDRVTVLGSGWLLELPLAEMIERTGKVVLIDIIHPPEVYSQTAGMDSISVVEQDATGGLIEEVWEKAGKRTFLNRLPSISQIIIPEYQPDEDPGMVISLNILTQLEFLPLKLLRAKTKATESELLRFREEIQKNHIRFLMKYRSVLISDVAEIFTEDSGKTTEEKTALVQIPGGRVTETWIWDFDIIKQDFNRKRSVLNVTGVIS